MKIENATHRRHISASKGEELRHGGKADWIGPRLARTYNIVTNEWTEWLVVPDDDPRMDTVETLR